MKNIFIIIIILMLIIDTNIAQTGNVGIGTTNPTSKLHVNGSVKITDGTQGAGKVLTSDASGKGSWQTLVMPPPPDTDSGYQVVYIGCTPWMTTNLNVSTYRNGDPIPEVSYPGSAGAWAALTTGAYCHYNNDPDNDTIYGKLYNWYAVNDPRGLAPDGWHVATDFEWTTLINTLGGSASAGGPMKALGTEYWNDPNLGATNLCNFTALPGGQRNGAGSFSNVGNFGYWWTSTRGETEIAWSRDMNYSDMEVNAEGADWNFGYSVRCVKD